VSASSVPRAATRPFAVPSTGRLVPGAKRATRPVLTFANVTSVESTRSAAAVSAAAPDAVASATVPRAVAAEPSGLVARKSSPRAT
jgi:hypothetical protein